MRQSILLFCLCAFGLQGFSQNNYTENVAAYISKYKDLAIEEQHRTGIPAAIKLAQGIFESGAGTSELCNNANNHFGIKCKSNWQGSTYAYSDDAKDECFRKYDSDLQSFRDHSNFLKQNKRYQSLFNLSATDYAAWAYGLKSCGYATDPQYAKKLIKTIETLQLQQYTYLAMETPAKQEEEVLLASSDAYAAPQTTYSDLRQQSSNELELERQTASPDAIDPIPSETDYYQVTTKEGKKGFYAKKGDMLLEAAIKNRIRYARLLELNDLQDRPLEADMFIYLEKRAKPVLGLVSKTKESLLMPAVADRTDEEKQGLAFAETETVTPAIAKVPKETKKEEEIIIQEELAPTPVSEQAQVATMAEATEEVNIADEPAIEEIMHTEQDPYAVISTPNNQTLNATEETEETAPDSQRSPLDKLKAYMDKTVYVDKQQTAAINRSSSVIKEEESYTATVPARRLAQSKNNNTSPEVHASISQKTAFHTVVRGDTAFSISKKYGITISQLQQWNKLSSATVPLGKRLRVKAP